MSVNKCIVTVTELVQSRVAQRAPSNDDKEGTAKADRKALKKGMLGESDMP